MNELNKPSLIQARNLLNFLVGLEEAEEEVQQQNNFEDWAEENFNNHNQKNEQQN